MVTSPNS